MYSLIDVERVQHLRQLGRNISQIARETGIARSTIRSWLDGFRPGVAMAERSSKSTCRQCGTANDPFPRLTDAAYAYLLGIYLGDGWVSDGPRGAQRLRISLDTAYPVIIEECVCATSLVAPFSKVSLVRRAGNVVDVSCWWKHWPCLFPQHGPGPKHDRPIVLDAWQRQIVDRWPWRFIRGLIHSDGSRFMNPSIHPQKTYWYSRYSFSNKSEDIKALFEKYCAKVGVETRRAGADDVTVSKRASVTLMDEHIGPKR